MTSADLSAISPWLLVFVVLVGVVAVVARVGWDGTAWVVRWARRRLRRPPTQVSPVLVPPPLPEPGTQWGPDDDPAPTREMPVVVDYAAKHGGGR